MIARIIRSLDHEVIGHAVLATAMLLYAFLGN
jgi:hypothetical protein